MEEHSKTGSIEEMINYILDHNIQPPKTYMLNVDFKDDDGDTDKTKIEFFKDIFSYAMKKKYRVDNLLQLEKEQFNTLNYYMQSLGVKFNVTCNNSTQNPWEVETLETLNIAIQIL